MVIRKKTCINLNPETIKALDDLAKKYYLTKSRYVEQLILREREKL